MGVHARRALGEVEGEEGSVPRLQRRKDVLVVRVLIVDDSEIVRLGVMATLGREPDMHVAATATSAADAIDLIPPERPDVVVVNYCIENDRGVEACERIRRHFPDLPIVLLTGFAREGALHDLSRAEADAYVRDSDGPVLKRVVRRVAEGVPVTEEAHSRGAGHAVLWPRDLSPREREVLRLIARGSGNQEMAKAMGVSEHTVKTYLQRALAKLGARTRSEGVAEAAKRGLL